MEDDGYMLITKTQTPDWLESEDWGLRFPKHHLVTLPPTNQKNVLELITYLVTLTPNVPLKKLLPESHWGIQLS